MAQRYCGMCDKWVPARETECRACGAATDKAEQRREPPKVPNLMDALRKSLEVLHQREAKARSSQDPQEPTP